MAVNYFQDIFSTTNPSEIEEKLEEVSSLVTGSMNDILTVQMTEEEVRKALFLMNPKKAPGPDGLTAMFYQKAWPVIKKRI